MKQLYSSFANKDFQLSHYRQFSIFIFLLAFYPKFSSAQLIVTPATAQQIVTHMLGCGSVAANVQMNCPAGASAEFNAVNTNLGIDSGVMFTSGSATNAIGPNTNCCVTTANGTPGYPPLNTLSGNTTFDACVLDFDVTLSTDTLRFNYVFGSDEYMEWVGSVFNDVFALWISGPGITGLVNLAVVPGTNFPVTQGNINCTIGNGAYYHCNDPLNSLCNNSYNCPTTSGATTIEYDGFTVPLQAKIAVIPGQTYHLTFAIADASDDVYDSGVFVQGGFLDQYHVNIVSDSSQNFVNPFDSSFSAVEGCQPGVINVHIENFGGDTVYLPLQIGGTATNGVDYTTINDTVVFLPGDTVQSIFVGAFADGIPEGTETVIIYTLDPCSGLVADSFVMNIVDDFPFNVSNDTTICEHDSLPLSATYSPYYHYHWEPAAYVSCDTCATTTAFPPFSTGFIVGVTLGNCTSYDTIQVNVTQVDPQAGEDQNLCKGDTTQLVAIGGTAYSWSPPTGLSNPMIANPLAFPTVTTTYIVTATGTNPLCHDKDTVTINVVPNLVATAGVDTSVCPGKPVQLWATGGVFYEWQPDTYLDYNKTADPISSPFLTTTYTVVVSNIYQCKDTVSVTVTVFPDPLITLNQPYNIYVGESAQLFAHGGVNSSYSWQPALKLDDATIYNPYATPDSSTTYYVVITTSDGCLYFDSTRVNVSYETFIAMPNAFTPNGDGLNDEFKLIARGPIDLNSFKIFDRWGNPIFMTNNVDDGWNGKVSGKDAEIGTYVYVIEATDGNGRHISKRGNFLLLR